MKTNKRIRVLAEDTRLGHRASAHQEFRAVVESNGYEMSRGGWVKFGGEHVTRGWESLASMVLDGSIILREPAEAEEAERETYSREYANTGTTFTTEPVAIPLDVVAEAAATITETAEELAPAPRVVYFYTTRTHTIPLSELAEVTTVIQDEATAETEGPCESGAALNCAGSGFLRVLPESLLGGQAERIIQCQPCYEVSAQAYARKAHHYAEPAE